MARCCITTYLFWIDCTTATKWSLATTWQRSLTGCQGVRLIQPFEGIVKRLSENDVSVALGTRVGEHQLLAPSREEEVVSAQFPETSRDFRFVLACLRESGVLTPGPAQATAQRPTPPRVRSGP